MVLSFVSCVTQKKGEKGKGETGVKPQGPQISNVEIQEYEGNKLRVNNYSCTSKTERQNLREVNPITGIQGKYNDF